MANIDGEIVWQANDNTWFTTNAAEVYPVGLTIYHVDGRYKFTDGLTALSALPFLGSGGGSGVQSVTGTTVDNTDPLNPIVNIPTLQQVIDVDYGVSGVIASGLSGNSEIRIDTDTIVQRFDNGSNYSTITVDNDSILIDVDTTSITLTGASIDVTAPIFTYNSVEVATVNDIVDVDVNTIGAAINGASSATPNDTDLVMSVESSVAKKNTWTQIKAFLKTYFDTLYLSISTTTLPTIYPVTVDATTTSSSPGLDLTDLTIPLLASSRYIVRGSFAIGCSGAGGVKFKSTLSGATISNSFLSRISTNDTARWSVVAGGTYSGALSTAASASGKVLVDCTLTTVGAGNLVFNMGAVTGGSQTATLFSEGSYLEVIKIS